MEIIAGLEASPRGAYCGAIGRLAPDGDARVQCRDPDAGARSAGERTRGSGSARGSSRTARPATEWRECLAKGAFVATAKAFDLIETMRFDPHEGVARSRPPSRADEGARPRRSTSPSTGTRRATSCRPRPSAPGRAWSGCCCRASGAIAIELRPLPPPPGRAGRGGAGAAAGRPRRFPPVATRPATAPSTTRRGRRRARSRWSFVDAEGFLTEGSFTNLFVERDGKLLTPPLDARPAARRAARGLIDEGRAVEARSAAGRSRRRLPDRQCACAGSFRRGLSSRFSCIG